jgi:molybdate transport repressor ModE-like protein
VVNGWLGDRAEGQTGVAQGAHVARVGAVLYALRMPRSSKAARIEPRIKGWLALDGEFLMGPRYVRILEGIEAHGSIRAACAETGLSYRTCLNRLRQMERVMGRTLVVTERGGAGGGSAALTPEARHLIRVYRGWRRALQGLSDRAFRQALHSGN